MERASLIACFVILLTAIAVVLWGGRPVDLGLPEIHLINVGTDQAVVYCPPQEGRDVQTPITGCVRSKIPPLRRSGPTLTGQLNNQIHIYRNRLIDAIPAFVEWRLGTNEMGRLAGAYTPTPCSVRSWLGLRFINGDRPAGSDLMVTIRTFNKFQQASQVFAQGEEITIELSVTNLTSKKKALRTSIHHFYLKNESGENVWDQPPPPRFAASLYASRNLNRNLWK